MGASLPLLAAVFTRRGLALSSSAAFNTAGAVLGVVAAGFLAIPPGSGGRLLALIDFAVAGRSFFASAPSVPWTTTAAQEPATTQQAQQGEPAAGHIEPAKREAQRETPLLPSAPRRTARASLP
jgi:hypothetical protein